MRDWRDGPLGKGTCCDKGQREQHNTAHCCSSDSRGPCNTRENCPYRGPSHKGECGNQGNQEEDYQWPNWLKATPFVMMQRPASFRSSPPCLVLQALDPVSSQSLPGRACYDSTANEKAGISWEDTESIHYSQ